MPTHLTASKSPSLRGRGLKSHTLSMLTVNMTVALFTRAWIEMYRRREIVSAMRVALFTRAWIEIDCFLSFAHSGIIVALFTRAWIEIRGMRITTNFHSVALFTRAWIEMGACLAGEYNVCKSPSLRGRGLKFVYPVSDIAIKCRPLYEGVD